MIRSTLFCLAFATAALVHVTAASFPFEPARDEFKADAELDLRWLNEKEAGESGWLKVDEDGDFVNGKNKSIRIWAVNSDTTRGKSDRPQWREKKPSLDRHGRWLAKIGVNMVRCHSHLNPSNDPHKLDGVDMKECEWIWRTVSTMKKHGIYTTVSPFWAREGMGGGLLFFDPKVQGHYKNWLKILFTTPRPEFGGKTLAEEPALGIFQIQNEDSLLFWTVNNVKGDFKKLLGQQLGAWLIKKYGSIEKAREAWAGHDEEGDDWDNAVLGMVNIWHATKGAKDQNNKQTQRTTDQVQFFTETMYNFNKMIGDYVHNELNCPVVINAGNWKTADNVLLNDAERYSYTPNEVMAVNRYFGGMHNGKHRGWAIINGDEYTSDSALTDAALSLPTNLKLTKGKPMMITESSWVMPNEYAAESPFLIAAYSSLTGFDAYYWFSTSTETWTEPRSANGYLPSASKWVCMTPDMAGQFPGAALAFRQGYIAKGAAVVEEHRSLRAIYERKSPMLAEEASFDPNRDAGDQPADSNFKAGVSPYAFLAGPVEVVYDSNESKTKVTDLTTLIKDVGTGKEVTSVTGEIIMNTDKGFCTVNTEKCQGVSAHFVNRQDFAFDDVTISCANDFGTVMVVSYDGKALKSSEKVLVQLGMQCRPSGWQTTPSQIKKKDAAPIPAKKITNYGKAPWMVQSPEVVVTIKNKKLKQAHILNTSGEIRETVALQADKGVLTLTVPSDALHIMLSK